MNVELSLDKDYTDEQVALMHKIVARHYGKKRRDSNKDFSCIHIGIAVYHREMLDDISRELLMSRQETINSIVTSWVKKNYPDFDSLKQRQSDDGRLDYYLRNFRSINAKFIADARYARVADGGPSKIKPKLHTLPIRPFIKEYLQHIAIEEQVSITDAMAKIIEDKYSELFN